MPLTGVWSYGTTYKYYHKDWFFDSESESLRVDLTGGFTMSGIPDPGFNQRAFEAMQPDLETSLQLSVFLAELTDVKKLLEFFTKWSKSFTKNVAKGHLSWSFGVKPFISDVKKLYATLVDHQQSIDDFLARRGTEQIRHYSEGQPLVTTTTDWTSWFGSASLQYRYVVTEETWTTATMRYRFYCDDIADRGRQLSALRDMLGLRLTQSVIWEAIPFSFVVDWFFRVGDWLKANEKPLIRSKVEVEDYCISHKYTYRCTRQWRYWADASQNWAVHSDTNFYGKVYRRKRELPDSGNTFVNRGQYGLNQLALSASLLRVLQGGR